MKVAGVTAHAGFIETDQNMPVRGGFIALLGI